MLTLTIHGDQEQSVAVEVFNSAGEIVGFGHVRTDVQSYIRTRDEASWARVSPASGDSRTFRIFDNWLRVQGYELEPAFQESASLLESETQKNGFSRKRRMSEISRKTDVVLSGETRVSLQGAQSSNMYVDDHFQQVNFLMEEQTTGKLTLTIIRGRSITRVGLPGDAVSVAVAVHELSDGGFASSLSVKTSSPEADAITSHMSSGQLTAARCYLEWALDALQRPYFQWRSVPAALLVRALGSQNEIGAAAFQWRSVYQHNPDIRGLSVAIPELLELDAIFSEGSWYDLPAYSAVTRMLLQAARNFSSAEGEEYFRSLSSDVGYLPQSSPFTVSSQLVSDGFNPGGGLPLSVSVDASLPAPMQRIRMPNIRFG